MKRFVGYVIDKAVKALPRKKKVSPTIKSVKPTKDIKGSIKKTKSDLEYKNLENVGKLRKQKEEGIKSAIKASRELQRAAETKRATKIGRQYFARSIPPRASDLNNPTVAKTKKFKTGKQIEAEKRNKSSKDFFETQVEKRNKASKKAFMGGGMAGRRMGYAMGLSVKPAAKKIKKLMDESKAKKQDAARVKFDAKKSDLDKSGDLSKYEKRRGMAIAKAMSKRNKKII